MFPASTSVSPFGASRTDGVPGFRVGETDVVPGFRVGHTTGVPGFRVNADGSIRTDSPGQYINVRNDSRSSGRSFWRDIVDAAEWAGTRANAVVNGAYSVFPGVYDAGRAVVRGTGLLGSNEFQRSVQESEAVGGLITRAAEHPEHAARTVGRAISELDKNPLFRYYMGGRMFMGLATGLGPAAMAGSALRALEDGHNAYDIFKRAIQGEHPPDR